MNVRISVCICTNKIGSVEKLYNLIQDAAARVGGHGYDEFIEMDVSADAPDVQSLASLVFLLGKKRVGTCEVRDLAEDGEEGFSVRGEGGTLEGLPF